MPTVRDQRKEETRRRVYEAAIEIFRRDGVAACRIDDIASSAGVSRGTFYFHFPTKEDVLSEYLHETERQITSALDEVALEAPLQETLVCLSNALVAVWQEDPRLLPDVAAVALRTTATALSDSESGWLRAALAERFRIAAGRGELGTMLPAEFLSDLYLGHILCGLLAWYGNQTMPLLPVLQGVNTLFWQGAGDPRSAPQRDRSRAGGPA